nr:hypothetical protein [Tanacetum cinerariifolium]GEX42782.1 hypothetical protein [Tanacetum cinerariifolium]
MSLSTISSDSMDESIGSSASIVILFDSDAALVMAEVMIAAPPTRVLDPSLVVDSEFEPFEDPSSLLDTADSDSDAKPLGSPTTSDYFAGLEFSKLDPSGDDSSDATSKKDEPPLAQTLPAFAPQT